MTFKELLKIMNSTDEERRLALERIEVDLESIIETLKKNDYFDANDLMNGVNKENDK